MKDAESYYFYLSLLNSDLLWWYLRNTGTVLANGYFRFKPDYLNSFPLPKTEKWLVMDVLSRMLIKTNQLSSNNKFNSLNKVSNALILQFYFPDHMKKRNIDILDFVEKDIEGVIQNSDFDQLTNDQKEKAIKQLHTKWTDPKSEIVKRMNSFAEKSPDILKPIMESR